MIDFLGFIYDLAKDLKDYWEWNEETKLVDFDWLEKSGFQAEAEKSGLKLRWSRPEKVESRILDGYEGCPRSGQSQARPASLSVERWLRSIGKRG